jgi:hypothetical protein
MVDSTRDLDLLADGFTLLGHGVAPWERSARLSLED